jgi:hypothetical protein
MLYLTAIIFQQNTLPETSNEVALLMQQNNELYRVIQVLPPARLTLLKNW